MKKLGLLIAALFLFAACDSKPSGNKGVLPVTHDTNMEEAEPNTQPAAEKAEAAPAETPADPSAETSETAAAEPAAEQPAEEPKTAE